MKYVKEKRGNSGSAGSAASNSGAAASGDPEAEPSNSENISQEEASRYPPPGWSISKDEDAKRWQVRKRGAKQNLSRAWTAHGGSSRALSMVVNYAWGKFNVSRGMPEAKNPHVWMRRHNWREGRMTANK